jgi:alpha-tubulin suppressor-like RCC1 family protein
MPNPNTNFKLSDGRDLGSVGITKEYLMTVYPQIANQLITPELWVWGRNDFGILGIDNTTSPKCTPVTTFAGGTNWKQVSGGGYFASAIKTDGTLWTWGWNDFGKLGVNAAASGFSNGRTTPVTTFAGGTNWKQVSCGNGHMAAIKTDGTLWNWGWNQFGQLGLNNTTSPKCTPVTTFAGGTNWKEVGCGWAHTAAIKTDGTLWTWGYNFQGQLGINNTTHRCTPVTTFAGGTNWKQVDCGGGHTAAIKTDGTLWTWGSNAAGQLGINVAGSTNNRTTPVTTFAGGTNWKQVSCGNDHTAAIKTDGTLWTWGSNAAGQLGVNDTNTRCTPVTTFAGGTNWKQVAASSNFFNYIAAIKTDGTLWTWGSNTIGQLGINDSGSTHRCTPVTTFAGGTNWKQVAAGGSSSFAIKTSDDLIGI